MTFEAPAALLGLLAVPVLVAGYVVLDLRRRRRSAAFARPALQPNLVAATPGPRRHLPVLLALAAVGLLVLGAARPHLTRTVSRQEATIVLAIDTSRSMAATDVSPSRFAAARAAVEQLLETVPDRYRVGIVSFSGSAAAVLQPTTDREAARVALRELRLGAGTAIGAAIDRSVDLARAGGAATATPTSPGAEPPAAVLLLSDGAQTVEGSAPLAAAARARRLGVPVSTVALGTRDAAVTVPLPGGVTERVTVPPDPQTLRRVAAVTGGTFSEALDAQRLRDVYGELGTRLAREHRSVEVTSAFAAGGALVLLLGGALSTHWFRRAL